MSAALMHLVKWVRNVYAYATRPEAQLANISISSVSALMRPLQRYSPERLRAPSSENRLSQSFNAASDPLMASFTSNNSNLQTVFAAARRTIEAEPQDDKTIESHDFNDRDNMLAGPGERIATDTTFDILKADPGVRLATDASTDLLNATFISSSTNLQAKFASA